MVPPTANNVITSSSQKMHMIAAPTGMISNSQKPTALSYYIHYFIAETLCFGITLLLLLRCCSLASTAAAALLGLVLMSVLGISPTRPMQSTADTNHDKLQQMLLFTGKRLSACAVCYHRDRPSASQCNAATELHLSNV